MELLDAHKSLMYKGENINQLFEIIKEIFKNLLLTNDLLRL